MCNFVFFCGMVWHTALQIKSLLTRRGGSPCPPAICTQHSREGMEPLPYISCKSVFANKNGRTMFAPTELPSV